MVSLCGTYLRYIFSSRANNNGDIASAKDASNESVDSRIAPQNEFSNLKLFPRYPISVVSQSSESAWIHKRIPYRPPPLALYAVVL